MRRNLIIAIICTVVCTNVLWSTELAYVISPNLNAIQPEIDVEVEIHADSDGNASLIYFDEAWGETNLFDCLSNLSVANNGARIKAVPKQNKIYVKGKPNEKFIIKYTIRQDFEGTAQLDNYYRPIINIDYFHLFGHRLFIIPEAWQNSDEAYNVRINWDNVSHLVQHNFGTEHNGTYILTKEELLESVVVGGDFRKHSVDIDGVKLQLLTRGDWKGFKDDELLSKVSKIVQVQREFWNDFTDDIYTVTLLPLEESDGTYLGGTGLANGFASYCVNSNRLNIENLTSLYYHEIMHHWIGGKIRNATTSEELWFSEGFTEYFAHLLMLQEREITKREFREIERNIRYQLKNSEYQSIQNSQISLNSATEKIPYQRGFLYASYLDNKLKKERDITLKDLMLDLLASGKTQHFTNELFKSMIGGLLGQSEVLKFEDYIVKGKLSL